MNNVLLQRENNLKKLQEETEKQIADKIRERISYIGISYDRPNKRPIIKNIKQRTFTKANYTKFISLDEYLISLKYTQQQIDKINWRIEGIYLKDQRFMKQENNFYIDPNLYNYSDIIY